MDAGSYGFIQGSISSNKDSSFFDALSSQRSRSKVRANCSYSSEENTSETLHRDNGGTPIAACTYSFEKNTSEIQRKSIRIAPCKKTQEDDLLDCNIIDSALKEGMHEGHATQKSATNSHKDDADNSTECGLDDLCQQEYLQANLSSSCAPSSEANSLQIPNKANNHISTACAKNQENDGNCTDSGLDGMHTGENTSILQKGCLPADDDQSFCISLSKKNSMNINSQANTQTLIIMGADKKLQADDGDVANTKESGLNDTSSPGCNALMEQEGLLVKHPSFSSSLLEEKSVEAHNSIHNQLCVMTNNQVDDGVDGIVTDNSFERMTCLHQDYLHATNPSDTPSLEKRPLEMQFRADKQVRNARHAGQEDGGGIVSVPDRDPHSLNTKEFTRHLKCLLQQDDIDLKQVFLIQAQVIDRGLEQDNFLSNILMSMYRRVGSMEEAALIFNKMLHPSVVSWTAMISLLSENKLIDQAFQLYLEMRKQGFDPNQITLITTLSICTKLAEGKAIHAYICDHIDQPCTKLLNALICMYGKCGDVAAARAVFDNMQVRDVVSWNSILAAYSENIDGKRSKGKEPIELFWQMQQESLQPDVVTLIAVLGSCANATVIPDGISIHAYIIEHGFESSISVGNALVNMYGKCRALDDAFIVFARRLPKANQVSWNALITACSEQAQASKAFQVFQDMVDQGVTPNNITFLSMLGACAQPEALAVGKAIHKEISRSKFKSLVYISNALINMYGKCGDLEDAQLVFDSMSKQNLVSWSTLIAAYCENGKGEEALELSGKMQHANVQPNEIVFLNLLTACCHAELLKEGTFFFTTMVSQYHIRPTLKHYNCMVDLLGRVGQLAQAEDLIDQMPCAPDSQIWMALLGACRVRKDAKQANRIAKHVLHLMQQNVPTYVQLPYVDGRWDDVDKVRESTAQSV